MAAWYFSVIELECLIGEGALLTLYIYRGIIQDRGVAFLGLKIRAS